MSWRYENYGTANLLKVKGENLGTVETPHSKFGFAYYASERKVSHFDIPNDSKEIWVKFDAYFTRDFNKYNDFERLRVYNGRDDSVITGFSKDPSIDQLIYFNYSNYSNDRFSASVYANSEYAFLFHMRSGLTGGVFELWVNGSKEQAYFNSVNNGEPFDCFYIYSTKTILISNVIISDVEIGLHENVSRNNLGLRYIFPEFKYKNLIAGYNLEEISQSVWKYNESVKSLADTLLNRIKDFETLHLETILKINSASFKLETKYISNPNLTAEENNLLRERQIFLLENLNIDVGKLKNKIFNVKMQIEQQEKQIDVINLHENSLEELAEIQNSNRPNFSFVVDNFLRMIMQSVNKINFFNKHQNFISYIVNLLLEWNDNYKSFKTNKYEELINVCHDNGIDEEVFKAWYEDWQKKRFSIEQRFLPLVNFALKGNLLSEDDSPAPAERVLEILQGYKKQVDNFYLNERKNIYQKFAFQAGGDLQEKFETESELYKMTEKLQSNLSEIIFSRDKTEERLFLLDWTKPLLNLSIDEIIDFVADNELSSISSGVLGQFSELKRCNLATYIVDSKAYAEALKQRESEYNALMFRMRKDLQQQ